MPKNLRLHFFQCPGDTLVATAAVRCLHEQYPGQFVTDVEGIAAEEIFANNPYRTKVTDPDAWTVRMDNPGVSQSDKRPTHFLSNYCEVLGAALGINLSLTLNKPDLYVSEAEKSWVNQVQELTGKKVPFWLICSGVKTDYTTKGWGFDNYQAVVNILRGKIQFVQVGAAEHNHKPLAGVIDYRGKTDLRQLIRLAYHSAGAIGPESLLNHLFAAFGKPYVCLLSGFLPRQWVAYPTTTILTRQQYMKCCVEQGCCWRSRTVALKDGDHKDYSLCELPMYGGSEPVPKCLEMIRPEETAEAVMNYYEGGRI